MILKGLKFNSFLAKNCKPSIYRALEKRVESQVYVIIIDISESIQLKGIIAMKGQIANFSPQHGQGIIMGDDGKNYPFTSQQWQQATAPMAG